MGGALGRAGAWEMTHEVPYEDIATILPKDIIFTPRRRIVSPSERIWGRSSMVGLKILTGKPDSGWGRDLSQTVKDIVQSGYLGYFRCQFLL